MGRVAYCTREQVQDAFDVREAAHRSAQIDRAILSASDDIDGWLNRHKHGVAPVLATRYFDWPSNQYSSAQRIWFDENELISAASVTAGGSVIAPGDLFLEPVNSGPPFTYVEINRNSSGSFSNAGTRQRAVAIEGLWGLHDQQRPAGELGEPLDASETEVDVTNGSLVGVGHLITVGTERMNVTGKLALDTTQDIQADLLALKQNVTVSITPGAPFFVGETIVIDGERMRITDRTNDTLTVIRAYDGSVLAAHTTGAGISALRTLVVERGVRGTTAATHLLADPVTYWDVPDLINALCVAETITRIEQEVSAYGGRVYSDEAERDSSGTEVVAGRGLTDIRKSAARRYKRKFRKRAV